ncbi:MAG: LysM peptidoglycan-binding domain-containing protein [Candidatus Methylomirabilales bacterium]
MALTRVVIKTDADETIQASADTRIFFNPNQYALQKRVNWKERKGRGMDLPQVQFDSGGARSLSLSLMFDTYEGRTDVREFTKQVAKLAEVAEGKDRPPVCTITWGPDAVHPYAGLPFQGVVESLTQKFTLFLDNGTPVRATLDVQFKGIEDPERQLKRTPRKRSSPLQAKTRVVRQGDSLWGIAAAEYGNPSKWRPIAEANNVINPRELEPGQVLIIPSLE